MLASSALMAPYLESLAGYPVETRDFDGTARHRHDGRRCCSRAGSPICGSTQADGGGLLMLGLALYSMS